MMTERKKLIEVALPLEEINQASAREKSIRHGHPSTLHLWWARRPLAACRAVLFASIVDDPSSRPDLFPTEAEQERERERLFGIIRRLVQWENSTNEEVLREAREEILKATNGNPPPVLDPFCGGGSIPLEAQRLGLEAHASDLNPVAVLITKALIEIPPKFAGRAPVSQRAGSLGSAGILSASKRSETAETAALPASDPNLAAETAALPNETGSAGILPAHPRNEAAETAALPAPPKLWYSRGYVPHFDHPGLVQFITFRLVDSLPRDVIERLIHAEKDDIKRREQLETYLDAGHGQCLLQDPAIAAIVENALLHFDGQRYRLLSWVIMPNHVHVLIETFPGHPLSTIVHSWKSYTAKEISRRIGREGEVWQREYFDRYIRNERHLTSVIDYIENNPVKAGLVARPDEWPFGSARHIRSADGSAGILPAHLRNEAAETAALPNETGSAGILPAHPRNEAAETAALPNEAAGSADGSAGILPAHLRNEADGSAGILPAHPRNEAAETAALPGFRSWPGARGLAEDVRFYGKWMRDEAEKRIGHLYPAVEITPEMAQERPDLKPLVGQKLTVIAWLWARTVRCPNPACGAEMPLVRSFWLSTKKGKEAWVEPVVDNASKKLNFVVRTVKGPAPVGTVGRTGAQCLFCEAAVSFDHIRKEARRVGLGSALMAIVAEGARGRAYVSPTWDHIEAASTAVPRDALDTELPNQALGFRVQLYGMTKHRDLFTPRQLVALTTFSDLVAEARERVRRDAVAAGLPDDGVPLNDGGTGATAYADAVATYLAFAVDRLVESSNTLSRWQSTGDKVAGAFSRQALAMVWDYAEVNPFSRSTRNFGDAVEWVAESLESLRINATGTALCQDVTALDSDASSLVVSTDPPYYDNIGYADLSDFFYVWLRRSMGSLYPDLFRTLLTPKASELIASPYRHNGNRLKAEQFFEDGLFQAFSRLKKVHCPDYPMTVYYAFRQAEADNDSPDLSSGVASTGWETMLSGLLQSGFSITGTWPMRTERTARTLSLGTNALASSIVVVCRPRPADAPVATRRQFLAALRDELPEALIRLQHGNIAPVDLAQAAIGPGMAVFSRYARVLEADGSPMSVRTALALINQELDAYLEAQEGELDPETRFCIAWYEQHGYGAGPYGEADVLARAKNTAVGALERAGIVESKGGKVRLLRRDELQADWDPERDRHKPVWECMQQVIRRFETEGAAGAGALLGRLGTDLGEQVRALAYRLYTLCERRGRAEEALAYNGLVIGWHDIQQQVPAGVTMRQERFDV